MLFKFLNYLNRFTKQLQSKFYGKLTRNQSKFQFKFILNIIFINIDWINLKNKTYNQFVFYIAGHKLQKLRPAEKFIHFQLSSKHLISKEKVIKSSKIQCQKICQSIRNILNDNSIEDTASAASKSSSKNLIKTVKILSSNQL